MTNNPSPNQESWEKELRLHLISKIEQLGTRLRGWTMFPFTEIFNYLRTFIATEIQKARLEAIEEALDFIANNEGWEESRDLYASLLGVPRIYKGKIAKRVDYILLVNYQKGKE